MGNMDFYVDLLIGDLESFIISEKKKVSDILSKNEDISLEDTVFVLDRLSKSLKKTVNILDFVNQVDNITTLRGISILASEAIAWILFTLPSIEKNLPYFESDFKIYNRSVVDYLADILLELESFIEEPSRIKFIGEDLQKNINYVSMTMSHTSNILKKGLLEN